MNYLSVCSGIEAASVAWHDFGWNPVAFSEIEKFPSAVLAHRFPSVPNLGDMTKFHDWPNFSINLLVGGTPCQAFSVAGLRQGLADPRGNLTLTYLAVAAKYRPQWLVWENVPGVLSDRTNAFGQFLAGLAELGYGWAYRLLDAQYFGLAQRRKRVFVVACLGSWERAAAVLFEPESMRGDNPPSREARKEITGTLSARTQGGGRLGTDFDICGGLQASIGGADENDAKDGRIVIDKGDLVSGIAHSTSGAGYWTEGVNALRARAQESHEHVVTHSLRAEGFDASEDGTGRGTPLIPVISPTITSNYGKQVDSSDTSKGPNMIVDRWPASVAPTLNAHFGSKQGLEDQHALGGAGLFVPAPSPFGERFLCRNCGQKFGVNDYPRNPKCPCCHCMTVDDLLQGDNFPEGTKLAFAEPGSPNYPEPIAFSCKDSGNDSGEVSPTLRSMGHSGSHANAGGQVAVAFHPTQDPISSEEVTHGLGCGSSTGQASVAVAFQESQSGCREYDTSGCLRANGPGHDPVGTRIRAELSVRRLTPKECERLQGFPDNYTNIPWRTWQESERKGTSYESLLLKRGMKLRGPNVEACPDGPRYKALGNSMAVPCMRWIGKRIAATCVPLFVEDWS